MINLMKRTFGSVANVLKTPLSDYNGNVLGGKMVEFAGYLMPVTFKPGVFKEHMWCRTSSGYFDVSHMGQVKIFGKDREQFFEKLTVADVKKMKPGNSQLSLICNKNAGIIDDTIITKMKDHMHMVVNASNKEKDIKQMHFIKDKFFQGKDVQIKPITGRTLVAIQGPKTAEIMQQYFPDQDFSKFSFLQFKVIKMKELDCDFWLSRSGYTGEDGFEISLPDELAIPFMDILLKHQEIQPIGLGARDSLRLEAGMNLHGNEIDETTNGAEGGCQWTIRKLKSTPTKFYGQEAYEQQMKGGLKKKRVAFAVKGPGILRPNSEIFTKDGEKIGRVTSGTFSPVLSHCVGLCYVDTPHWTTGTELVAKLRGKTVPIEIVKTPMVPTNYFKPSKN